jgi:predicted RNA-binding Zn-ribbon protein involved in translation (DUF1610 family)
MVEHRLERRRLRALQPSQIDRNTDAVLALPHVEEAERAADSTRVGYECGHCGRLMAVEHRQTRYFGIVLRCPECGGANVDEPADRS